MLACQKPWEAPLAEIKDGDDFEKWLEEQPEAAAALAVRAALRVLPVVWTAYDTQSELDIDWFSHLALPVFWATAPAWAASAVAFTGDAARAAGRAADLASAIAEDVDSESEAANEAASAAFAAAASHLAAIDHAYKAVETAPHANASARRRAADAFWSAIISRLSEIENALIQHSQIDKSYDLANLTQECNVYRQRIGFSEFPLDGNEYLQQLLKIYETQIEKLEPPPQGVELSARSTAVVGGGGTPSINVAEPKPQRRRKKQAKPTPAPEVPPQQAAALEPVWSDGVLRLPSKAAAIDGDGNALVAALKVLRVEIEELAVMRTARQISTNVLSPIFAVLPSASPATRPHKTNYFALLM